MASIAASVAASETTISSLTFGSRSISYDSSPCPVPTMPFCTPRPVMRVMFRPQMPLAESASLTELSLSGRMIASIFCIVTLPPVSPASPENQLTSSCHPSHRANVTGLLSLQRRRHALLRRREVCRPPGGRAALQQTCSHALMLQCLGRHGVGRSWAPPCYNPTGIYDRKDTRLRRLALRQRLPPYRTDRRRVPPR